MFAVVTGNHLHRFASKNALVMNIDNDVAKRYWLENLNRPFGWTLEDNENKTEDLKVSENAKGVNKKAEENDEVAKEEAWFDILDEKTRHKEEDMAKYAWLSRLQKPVVHSKEELAKQAWFAKLK